MAIPFDTLLAERTKPGGTVHGAMMKCVDKHGNTLYAKTAGRSSLLPNAPPLSPTAVLKLGSATKLLTTIALLQCIDDGLLTLDEPIARVLPELDPTRKPILSSHGPSTRNITARHLLSHTSGLGYWFLSPELTAWKTQTANGRAASASGRVVERFDHPLLFEPGAGWMYGCSLDWAGVAVERLRGGRLALGDVLVERVWKVLGREAPFPCFFHVHDGRHGEYESRLMGSGLRAAGGGLEHSPGTAYAAGLDEDEGGAGLACTMGDFLAVLQDLVSDVPRLLKRETVDSMWEPQLAVGSPGMAALRALRPAWDIVAGPVSGEEVNHGLGGLLVLGEAKELGQPAGLLCWGGSPNIVWFVCRERGVAGFFGTQVAPFGDEGVRELVDGWKREFWEGLRGEGEGGQGEGITMS